MKAAVQAQLTANLKVLKLSAFLSHLEVQLRQARESKEDYADFLLALSELEVAARMENGCKRRIRDARFPLLKPIETFQFESAPSSMSGRSESFLEDDTSGRPAMSSCWAGAAREKHIWPRPWGWRRAGKGCAHDS